MCNKYNIMLTESQPQKNDLAGRNYMMDGFRDRAWQFILFSQGIVQILLLKNCFFLSAQSLLQLQVDASEGFKQQAAFCHKLHDCLPCNKLLASSHALGRFTCCAHQKQYQFKQILIFDLVKQIFLMQK